MKKQPCRELENWLERLPRQDVSPEFERHLERCAECREAYERLAPVAAALASAAPPPALGEKRLNDLAISVGRTAERRMKRALILKLSLICLVSLPVVVLVNWAGATLGYRFLADHISLFLARMYVAMFVVAGIGISGSAYAGLFLMAGKLWGRRSLESAS